MEEYERLEGDLKAVYEIYMERHRNLGFLEAQLERHRLIEQEKKQDSDRALKRMQKRYSICSHGNAPEWFFISLW